MGLAAESCGRIWLPCLTNSKLTIIEQLAHTNKVTAILLQETHCETTEKLTIPEFTLASHILNKQHGLATFVRQDIEWSLETQSEDYSPLEWLAVKVQNVTIINVYFFLCRTLIMALTAVHQSTRVHNQV